MNSCIDCIGMIFHQSEFSDGSSNGQREQMQILDKFHVWCGGPTLYLYLYATYLTGLLCVCISFNICGGVGVCGYTESRLS